MSWGFATFDIQSLYSFFAYILNQISKQSKVFDETAN